MFTTLIDKLRALPWLLLALLATAVVAWLAPYQLGVLVWSLSKLAFGAYLGYWIDRTIFHYARPHDFFRKANRLAAQDLRNGARHLRHQASLATLRRAAVMAAAILALGLGV
ncbi:putative holin [Halomonas saccharevitans]|uniref:Putative 2/3 transmembrane domain holin n=1 Tax=Halomonas saccharevitans TaxID=416872 RepID=A0A1I7AGM1_9GAMM|nr:putative holin [Halomonas saccharevitans]SFT74058.1 Putative 2/3 transmembrane domain holin [Halomonas saccharevitans]